jgi:hypothetical protein
LASTRKVTARPWALACFDLVQLADPCGDHDLGYCPRLFSWAVPRHAPRPAEAPPDPRLTTPAR